jgi:hypothetical protein
MALTTQEISIVKGMLARGDAQHHIAAYFGVNSARINDIKQGTVGNEVPPTIGAGLPEPGPYMGVRSGLRARETLIALRDLIDGAIKDIDRFEQADKG